MLPGNTLDILKKLSKEDLRTFGDFLKSPYFNTKETLYLLYKEVIRQHPDFKENKFEYKKIYKKIYGGEYKEQTIKNLFSELGNLLKKFIAHERLEEHEPDYNLALIKGLTDKKCFEQSNKIITAVKKSVESNSFPEEDKYIYLFNLQEIYYKNYCSINITDADEVHFICNKTIEYLSFHFLDVFYNLAFADSFTVKTHKVKKDYSQLQKSFLDAFGSDEFFNETNKDLFPATLKVRFLAYKYSISDITEKEYKVLEELVMNNIDKFSIPFKLYTWQILLYIIVLKLIPKEKKYYEDICRISDYFFNLKLFPNDIEPTISKGLITDTLAAALVLKKFDWAETFLKETCLYLSEDSRSNEMNYHLGRLKFHTGNYEESIDYLSKVKYTHVGEKINVRFYSLMNYIELKSYQQAISMLNSIRQFYLESKEIPEMFAVLVENSLKFFREIIRCEENNKKLDYSILKEAQNAGRYYQKQYILAKLEKLSK